MWFQQQGQTHFLIHAETCVSLLFFFLIISVCLFKDKVLGKIQYEIFIPQSSWFPWHSSSQRMISMPNEYLILILVATSRVSSCMFRIWIKFEKEDTDDYYICFYLPQHSLIQRMVYVYSRESWKIRTDLGVREGGRRRE